MVYNNYNLCTGKGEDTGSDKIFLSSIEDEGGRVRYSGGIILVRW